MENNTVEKWQEFSSKITIDDLLDNINNIPNFQIELSNIINSFYWEWKNVIEIGCEFWLTSFILNDWFEKNLLDFDKIALKKSKQIFKKFNKNAIFFHQDMFNMKMKKKFDIIFNAWVLEHFNLNERITLLKKYSEYLKNDWVMIIAIPNHYNFLYRLAYILLNFTNKWSFPKENMIYDMAKEIQSSWLILEKRFTVDKENIFTIWWALWGIMRKIFWLFIKEWYLTVLIIKKQ